MYPFYKAIAEKAGLPVYGCLPPVPEAEIPDRHLGLVTAQEIGGLQAKLDRLADAAEQGLDLDGLLALARSAPPLEDRSAPLAPVTDRPVRIAVAQDRAFCFYYADNFDVLRALGAALVRFRRSRMKNCRAASTGCISAAAIPSCMRISSPRTVRCARTSARPCRAACRRWPSAAAFCTCTARWTAKRWRA